jgi:AsmA protein
MKKLAAGILVFFLLVIAAALVAPFVVPTDAYKAKLIAAVKESTGRDLKIGGPIGFSLLPRVTLSAQDVSFANAPGGIARNMVQLKSMALKIKLLPLLTGTVAIDSLVLTDPAVALEIDRDGRANWDFSLSGTAPVPPGDAASSRAGNSGDGLSVLSSLRLGQILLQNGEVSYADQRSEKRWDAGAINLTLSMADPGSPLAAEGSVVWNDEQINLAISVANPGAFAGGNASDISVKLASNPFNLDFAGSGAIGPATKFSGAVELAVPSVRELAKWAGSPISMAGSLR